MKKNSPPAPKYYYILTVIISNLQKKKRHKALLFNSIRSDVGAHKHKWNRCQKTKKERIKIR